MKDLWKLNPEELSNHYRKRVLELYTQRQILLAAIEEAGEVFHRALSKIKDEE